MKTTIDLPEALVKRAKQKALHQGRSFKDLIAEYIRRGLNELLSPPVPGAAGVLEITPDGLPLFRGDSTPGYQVPTLEGLLSLERATLEQEDLQRAGLPG